MSTWLASRRSTVGWRSGSEPDSVAALTRKSRVQVMWSSHSLRIASWKLARLAIALASACGEPTATTAERATASAATGTSRSVLICLRVMASFSLCSDGDRALHLLRMQAALVVVRAGVLEGERRRFARLHQLRVGGQAAVLELHRVREVVVVGPRDRGARGDRDVGRDELVGGRQVDGRCRHRGGPGAAGARAGARARGERQRGGGDRERDRDRAKDATETGHVRRGWSRSRASGAD